MNGWTEPPPPPRLGPAGINTLCLSGSERSVEDFQAYVLRIKPDVNIKDIASPWGLCVRAHDMMRADGNIINHPAPSLRNHEDISPRLSRRHGN